MDLSIADNRHFALIATGLEILIVGTMMDVVLNFYYQFVLIQILIKDLKNIF